jgi:hypothetical protein
VRRLILNVLNQLILVGSFAPHLSRLLNDLVCVPDPIVWLSLVLGLRNLAPQEAVQMHEARFWVERLS